MIEMWDDSFSDQDPEIRRALERGNGADLLFPYILYQILIDISGLTALFYFFMCWGAARIVLRWEPRGSGE